jgi:hypothetical protein
MSIMGTSVSGFRDGFPDTRVSALVAPPSRRRPLLGAREGMTMQAREGITIVPSQGNS